MGAAAFLMVEYLSIPYQTIIIAAIVPACMHFFGVFCQVHFEAKKRGMRGMTAAELPRIGDVVRRDWPTSIPLLVLLVVLFSGFTPYLAAFWGITACILIGLSNRNPIVAVAVLAAVMAAELAGQLSEWLGVAVILSVSGAVSAWYVAKDTGGRERLLDVLDAFVTGAKYAISVGAAAAAVGIIVGVVTLTGIGFKLSGIITSTASDLAGLTSTVLPAALFAPKGLTLFYTLVMTAIVCILLGCGVPTTPTYIIMVTVAAPALAMMGVAPLVAHFFVFYYGVLADITPPVALAAYAGASMAGADPFKTGNTAFRLGLAKAMVPFVFVYSPAMLLVGKGFTWGEFFETTIGCVVGIVMLAAALSSYGLAPIRGAERLLLCAGLRARNFAQPRRYPDGAGARPAGSGASAHGRETRPRSQRRSLIWADAPPKGCAPTQFARSAIASAIFSAVISVGKLVLAQGTSGKIEASTTRRPSTPRTRPCVSVTAMGSPSAPMRRCRRHATHRSPPCARTPRARRRRCITSSNVKPSVMKLRMR